MVQTRKQKSNASAGFPPRSPPGNQRGSASRARGEPEEEDEERDTDEDVPKGSADDLRPPPAASNPSGSSVTSSGSRRSKLNPTLERFLLFDIEEAGGIHFFSEGQKQGLSNLLDSLLEKEGRSHLCGKRGDQVRRRIRQRIDYLKSIPLADYNALLKEHKLTPKVLNKKQAAEVAAKVQASPRAKKAAPARKPRSKTSASTKPKSIPTKGQPDSFISDLDDDDDDDDEEEEEEDVEEEKSAREPTKVVTMSETNSKTIVLDPDNPWDNPEDIMISSFKEHEMGAFYVDGFSIMVVGDPRDVARDRYSLTAVGSKPSNKFKFTKPVIPAGLWMDRDEWLDDRTAADAVKKGLKVAMQSFKDRPEADKKNTYTLKIKGGEHMQLTDKPFLAPDEMSDDLKIQPRHPIAFSNTEQESEGVPLLNLQTAVAWRLCDMSTKRKMRDDEEEKPKGQRGIAEALKTKMAKVQKEAEGHDARRQPVPDAASSSAGAAKPNTRSRKATVGVPAHTSRVGVSASKKEPKKASSASKVGVSTPKKASSATGSGASVGIKQEPKQDGKPKEDQDLKPRTVNRWGVSSSSSSSSSGSEMDADENEDTFQLSTESWGVIRPLLQGYIDSFGGELSALLKHCTEKAFEVKAAADDPINFSIEEFMVDYVKDQCRQAEEILKRKKEEESKPEDKRSSLQGTMLEDERKKLFKPAVASSTPRRTVVSEKLRDAKRARALAKARGTAS